MSARALIGMVFPEGANWKRDVADKEMPRVLASVTWPRRLAIQISRSISLRRCEQGWSAEFVTTYCCFLELRSWKERGNFPKNFTEGVSPQLAQVLNHCHGHRPGRAHWDGPFFSMLLSLGPPSMVTKSKSQK